jgi:molybdenum cofactor biosynthesis enzyme MoaA
LRSPPTVTAWRATWRWRDAGLTAINVSVDSLDARQFHAITGQDKFHQVMDGIDAALPPALRR